MAAKELAPVDDVKDKTKAPTTQKHRFNLVIPDPIYKELYQIASQEDVPVTEVIRKFIKVGLIAYDAQQDPEKKLIIRERDTDIELLLI